MRNRHPFFSDVRKQISKTIFFCQPAIKLVDLFQCHVRTLIDGLLELIFHTAGNNDMRHMDLCPASMNVVFDDPAGSKIMPCDFFDVKYPPPRLAACSLLH